MKQRIRTYYRATKPGLIYGNLFTVAGGYLYGANQQPSVTALIVVCLGSALVMASGTVINNILDRDIDKHMKRTKKRALVTGEISPGQASLYAAILSLLGLSILLYSTNTLTTLLGLIGLISYAGIYTYAKHRTMHATLIGTLPGALPPLAGYVSATNRVDASFWVLFAIMVCWQMVHFYAIAIFRKKEYANAHVPVITVRLGITKTKLLMSIFGCGYLVALVLLAVFGYAGLLYLAIMGPLTIWWLFIIYSGFWATDNNAWARKVFGISILLLPVLCLTLALNAWAP